MFFISLCIVPCNEEVKSEFTVNKWTGMRDRIRTLLPQ